MITLTYPAEFPTDGRAVKNDWRRMRQWLVRRGVSAGLCVLEFQARGAPHFHVLIQTFVDRHAIAEMWFRIVGSGDPNHLLAGTRVERLRRPHAAAAYAAKYSAKLLQKIVPAEFKSVGRFWSVWGKPKIAEVVELSRPDAVQIVRCLRRAYQAERRTWRHRRRFRDNGQVGFIAWQTSGIAQRILQRLTLEPVATILGVERLRSNTAGLRDRSEGSAKTYRRPRELRANRCALRADAHSLSREQSRRLE